LDVSSCPSVWPRVSERLQLHGFLWYLTWETFMNIFWEVPNLFKIRKKYLAFYIYAQVRPTEELLRSVWPSSELDSPALRHPPLRWCLSTYINIRCQNLIWNIKYIGSTLITYDHRAVIRVGTRKKTRSSATLFTINPTVVGLYPDHSKSRRRHGRLSLVSVLSGIGLCVGRITRLEESYWVLGVPECDRKVSIVRRSWPIAGCPAMQKKWYTDMRLLTTGIRSEKCVVRRFRRCANVIECTYTKLDSIAYYTPRLYGRAYCS
jgi:hypothetical protein